MIEAVETADAAVRAAFDEIIDVRSPSEFARDHVPGAVNLPVLSDAQRAEVGTLYVQSSKFLARRLGAAHVSRNIADHLTGGLKERDGSYRPLLYCWRGGQRSAAMATVLSQVGWRVGLLRGGYRTYRRAVVQALYDDRTPLDVVVLRGPTGSGKTALIAHLADEGVQTLDLEALAGHRGSVFGDVAGAPQPPQKLFESRLAAAFEALDPRRPLVVEAESSRIGHLRLPPRLWAAMKAAPVVDLETPLASRVARIVETYGPRLARLPEVEAALGRLPRHHGREQRQAWIEAARAGDAEGLARALLVDHYDSAYRGATTLEPGRIIGRVTLVGSSPADFRAAAREIGACLASREARRASESREGAA